MAPPLVSHLRLVVGQAAEIETDLPLKDLAKRARAKSVGGLILDTPADDTEVSALAEVLRQNPHLPSLIYTRLSPATFQRTATLSVAGARNVVLHRYDDDPRRFRELLESLGILRGEHGDRLIVPASTTLQAERISDSLIQRLAIDPEQLYRLHPGDFEDLVAELLARQGFDVRTTARTRDGGRDIVVASQNALGSFAYYVECKRYAPDRPVGVGVIRELFGVVQADRVTGGIVATTSSFTRDAVAFRNQVPHQISLREFADLTTWIERALRG